MYYAVEYIHRRTPMCFSTCLYGVEARILAEATSKRLEVIEMWCYHRMFKISYIYHVTNNTVI